MSSDRPATGLVDSGPFKFLDYFDQKDAVRFAGRERDVHEIVARISHHVTFVLYARSGLGKTSLLLAGVFPRLVEAKFEPVYIRTLQSPLADLQRLLEAKWGEVEQPIDPERVRTILAQRSQQAPVVIVLDQFEEYFIRFRGRPEEREPFEALLGRIASDSELDVRLVFSLREDYLAEMDDLQARMPGLLSNQFRLLPLTAFGTRQAIEAQLRAGQVDYEPLLLTRLVDQLDGVGFDPPLLQITCSEVYRAARKRAAGERDPQRLELKVEDLKGLGGLEGIFNGYLNAVLKNIKVERHFLVRTVLNALISNERTKKASTVAALLDEADFVAGEEEIRDVLEQLRLHRLVRRDTRTASDKTTVEWFELLHERLVPVVLDWLQLDSFFFEFRLARQFIANSAANAAWHKKRETLPHADQYKGVVATYQDRLRLDEAQTEFLLVTCIYRELDQLPLWAERFGVEKTVERLETLMADNDPVMRRGAAAAARRLGDPAARLAGHCLRLALEDAAPDTARAAGRALAHLAGPAELEALRQALRDRATRRRAIELLADFRAEGKALERSTWWQRWRASRRLRRRTLDLAAPQIELRARRGALAGLLAGLAWCGTTGLVLALLVVWTMARGLSFKAVGALLFMALSLPVALGLGGLFGWRAGAMAAQDAALVRREGRWFRLLWRSPTCVIFSMVLAGTLAYACMDTISQFDPVADSTLRVPDWLAYLIGSVLWGLVGGPVLLSVLGLAARTGRDAVWPVRPRHLAWWPALLGGLGLPCLLPLFVATVCAPSLLPPGEITNYLLITIIATFVLSLLA